MSCTERSLVSAAAGQGDDLVEGRVPVGGELLVGEDWCPTVRRDAGTVEALARADPDLMLAFGGVA
jgi:hypothetical protein